MTAAILAVGLLLSASPVDKPSTIVDAWGAPLAKLRSAPLSAEEAKRLEATKQYVVASMYRRIDRLSLAMAALRLSLQNDPKYGPSLRMGANIALQLDRRPEALDYCNRALALDPDDGETLYLAGLLTADKGDAKAAVKVLEHALSLKSLGEDHQARGVQIRQLLVDLYDQVDNHAGAAKVIGELVERAENTQRFELPSFIEKQLTNELPILYRRWAAELRKAKNFRGAADVIALIGKKNPAASAGLSVELAGVLLDSGDAAGALKTLEDYFQKNEPRAKGCLELFEQVLAKLGRKNEVLDRLEKLSEKYPNCDPLRRNLATKLFEKGEYFRAETVLKQSGNDREALPLMIRTAQKLKRSGPLLDMFLRLTDNVNSWDELEGALEDLAKDRELIDSICRDAVKKPAKEPSNLKAFRLVGLLANGVGLYEQAAVFFGRCAEIDPTREGREEYRRRLLLALVQSEKYTESAKLADDILRLRPNDVIITRLKALALAHLNRVPEAVAAIDALRAKLATPDEIAECDNALALVYQETKNWDKAASVFRRIIADHGDDLEALWARYSLSHVLTQQGKGKEAEAELQKIIDAKPRNDRLLAGANNDLAYVWADEGRNLDRAEAMIRLALRLEGDNAAYLDSLGWVLFKRGKYAEAKEHLQRAATSKAGDDPVVWDHLGDNLLQMGDKSGARAAWEKAVLYFSKGPRAAKEKVGPIQKKLETMAPKAGAPKANDATK